MEGAVMEKGIRLLLPTLADLSAISPPIPGSKEVSRWERVTIPDAVLDSDGAMIEESSSVSIASWGLSGLEEVILDMTLVETYLLFPPQHSGISTG